MQVACKHFSQDHPVAAIRSIKVKTAWGLPPSPWRFKVSQPTWRGAICILYSSPILANKLSRRSATCTIFSSLSCAPKIANTSSLQARNRAVWDSWPPRPVAVAAETRLVAAAWAGEVGDAMTVLRHNAGVAGRGAGGCGVCQRRDKRQEAADEYLPSEQLRVSPLLRARRFA